MSTKQNCQLISDIIEAEKNLETLYEKLKSLVIPILRYIRFKRELSEYPLHRYTLEFQILDCSTEVTVSDDYNDILYRHIIKNEYFSMSEEEWKKDIDLEMEVEAKEMEREAKLREMERKKNRYEEYLHLKKEFEGAKDEN